MRWLCNRPNEGGDGGKGVEILEHSKQPLTDTVPADRARGLVQAKDLLER